MKIPKTSSASLILCAFALSFSFLIPSTLAQQNREILRLGRGTANALDWQPDGEVLAVGGSTGLWLLDADLSVTAHLSDESVTALAWSPDGEKLATSTIIEQSCALQIWDINAKRALVESSECADKIAWKPDSQSLAITSPLTQMVSIINVDGSVILKDLPGRSAAWSPDGTRLAAIDTENLSIWNVTSQRKMLTTANQDYGDTLLWTDDGILTLCSEHDTSTYVVSMCRLNERTGVKIDSKVLLWRHPGEWGDLGRLRWNDEKNRFSFIISVPDDSAPSLAYVYDWGENGGSIITPASFAAWKPGTSTVTAALDSGLIQNVDAGSGNVLAQENVFTASVRSLAWSPDGERLASAGSGANQTVHIWDIGADSETSTLNFQPDVVNNLAWMPDGGEIFTAGANGTYASDVRAWDTRNGDSVRVIAQDLAPAKGIIAWNSDFTRKATSNGQRIALPGDISIKTARGTIRAIRWSPDSSRIATLSVNRDSTKFTIEIWQPQTGERIIAIQSGEMSSYDSTLYWSNDGTRLAHSLRIGGNDAYTLRVYDPLTGELVVVYDTPQWYAPKLAWRPDDRVLAVEILSGVIFLDTLNSDLIGEQIPMGHISALVWHPNGDRLAIGGVDGVIRVWEVSAIQ